MNLIDFIDRYLLAAMYHGGALVWCFMIIVLCFGILTAVTVAPATLPSAAFAVLATASTARMIWVRYRQPH